MRTEVWLRMSDVTLIRVVVRVVIRATPMDETALKSHDEASNWTQKASKAVFVDETA